MRRALLILLCMLISSRTGFAHFVFVVPETGGATARVLLSETLQPDAEVDVSLISGAALAQRDTAGRDTPLALTKADHAFAVSLKAQDGGVVHGLVDLGVMNTGAKSYVLLYHPKTIIGDAFDDRARLGNGAPVEIVPVGASGALRLLLLARGQPQAGVEMTVITPGGSQKVVKTDAQGRTEAFAASGRYGAWARSWEATAGERSGQRFTEVRHYATLVTDVGVAAQAANAGADRAAARVATLPEATSSFGAVVSDGWLYVYGGHIVPTHSYSTAAVSGRFSRLRLSEGKTWERLPDGPPLQGLNLAAHGGKIYRVGGMQPANKPGEAEDVRSIADVARFDPSTRAWERLPSLPAPRSSHDVVVVGDTLIVVGGWALKGKDGTDWPASMEMMNLKAPRLEWKSVPQPFKRRALTAAAVGDKVYVLGGFNERSQVVHGVSVYDSGTGIWSSGPDLPGGAMSGFGPAAAVHDGSLYVSVDDGSLHRLTTSNQWERAGRATPRIVHRLAPDGRRLLVIGGSFKGTNSDLVEAISVDR